MASPLTAPHAAGAAWPRRATLAALAVAAGFAVVALGQWLGPGRQPAAVAVLAALVPALFLFLARPRLVLLSYLFLLPLAVPLPVGAGLNAGEALTLVMVVLGSVALWYSRERLSLALSALAPVLWPLAAFVAVSAASSIVNDVDTVEGLIAAIFKGLAFGVVAVLVYVHADDRSSARALLLAILLGGAAVAFYSILAYLAGWSYSTTYGYNRASGTFSTWNHLGGFMALVSMPTLALAVAARKPSVKAFLLLAFVAEITALLLSLTLGSVVALLLAAAVGAVFLFRVSWRRLALSAFVAGAAFLAIWFANPLLRDKLLRIDERVIDRLRTYQVGLSMFRDQFWFGFGSPEMVERVLLLSTRYGVTAFGETSTVPHNALLLMGVEKGVFGLIFFSLLVGASLWLVVRGRRRFEGTSLDVLHQGLVVGALAFLIQSMTNNLVVHARLGILYFAIVALTVRFGEEAAGERGTRAA